MFYVIFYFVDEF